MQLCWGLVRVTQNFFVIFEHILDSGATRRAGKERCGHRQFERDRTPTTPNKENER